MAKKVSVLEQGRFLLDEFEKQLMLDFSVLLKIGRLLMLTFLAFYLLVFVQLALSLSSVSDLFIVFSGFSVGLLFLYYFFARIFEYWNVGPELAFRRKKMLKVLDGSFGERDLLEVKRELGLL